MEREREVEVEWWRAPEINEQKLVNKQSAVFQFYLSDKMFCYLLTKTEL